MDLGIQWFATGRIPPRLSRESRGWLIIAEGSPRSAGSDYSVAVSGWTGLGGLRKSNSSIFPNTAVAMFARWEAIRLE